MTTEKYHKMIKIKMNRRKALGFDIGHVEVYYEPNRDDVHFNMANFAYTGDDSKAFKVAEIRNYVLTMSAAMP